MGFKLQKLNLDLELDLTAYIPGEAGIIKPVKSSPEDIFKFIKHCTKISTDATKLREDEKKPDAEKVEITREHLISQIDFLYGKGESYWKAIPYTLLSSIIGYISEEVKKTEKKS